MGVDDKALVRRARQPEQLERAWARPADHVPACGRDCRLPIRIAPVAAGHAESSDRVLVKPDGVGLLEVSPGVRESPRSAGKQRDNQTDRYRTGEDHASPPGRDL